ncbi:MAG: DNA-3-methyladenine glycosylase [Kiritimatiellia bacterium]
MSSRRLSESFFLGPDVIEISRKLLGKVLCSRSPSGRITGGVIVETEAYAGAGDRASHAFGNRRTGRTAVMYRRGPVAYVYLCYGLHWLFNIITNVEGVPHAVLVRALQPVRGAALMARRRGLDKGDPRVASGPGAVSRALGITGAHSGESLLGRRIWVERGRSIPPDMVCSSRRIGVSYAGRDARRPWRFFIRGNACVSRRDLNRNYESN